MAHLSQWSHNIIDAVNERLAESKGGGLRKNLAKALGMSPSNLSKILNKKTSDESFTPDLLIKIAGALWPEMEVSEVICTKLLKIKRAA
jgi:transcriptional regulator with XRE-family HTH domain